MFGLADGAGDCIKCKNKRALLDGACLSTAQCKAAGGAVVGSGNFNRQCQVLTTRPPPPPTTAAVAAASKCTDAPVGWTSEAGHTCVTYETGLGTELFEPLCIVRTGLVTAAFQDVMALVVGIEAAADQEFGYPDDSDGNGVDASAACCACSGGNSATTTAAAITTDGDSAEEEVECMVLSCSFGKVRCRFWSRISENLL
jgi:hypothetical protein